MNSEGKTYLFFDKYADNNTYGNPKTKTIKINELFNSNYDPIEGKQVITEFNKLFGDDKIPQNLDLNFYNLYMFKYPNSGTETIITILSVDNSKLEKHINNIPNKQFLLTTCQYHCAYSNNTIEDKKDINKLVKKESAEANADVTDEIIENPTFTKLKLYDYQKRTVNWLLKTELESRKFNYSFNAEIFFGDLVYDTVTKEFVYQKDRKKIPFNGGLLADEVGLGKTFQMIVLCLMNELKNYNYFPDDTQLLQSKATLIFCPNQLCNQWIREFEKTINPDFKLSIIPMFTKIHHDKYTYMDLLDADFIIVSNNFLGNDCYYDEWLKPLAGTKKGLTYINSAAYNQDEVKKLIVQNAVNIRKNPTKLFDTKPLLNSIRFHRFGVDEFHEIETVAKYKHISKLVKLIEAKYKWCITGTPFDKSDTCLASMVDFTTNYNITNMKRVLELESIQKYILKSFFRKNTKKSVKDENSLQPLVEEIIKLKFSPTERAIYNAYIVNSNIDKYSVALRQLCNDPRIVDELKQELSSCKTPEDIQKTMVLHNKNATEKAEKKIRYIDYKIKKVERRIKITDFRRQRKFLRQCGYRIEIEYPEKIKDPEFDGKKLDDVDDNQEEADNDVSDNENSDDDNQEVIDKSKPLMIVNEENQQKIKGIISKQLSNNIPQTLINLHETLDKWKDKLAKAKTDFDGKRSTSEFFTNMMNKINQIINKYKEKKLKGEVDEDSDSEDEDDAEMCSICMNNITGEDVGVTKCGHMYCYQCIKEIVKTTPKCPLCTKPVKANEIYMISFDLQELNKTASKEIKDKVALIAKIGTKLANLIFYIKNSKEKCIIFSQWDDLLKKVGDVLDTYGVRNVFCRGNVWTRDKAIREFSSNDNIKVIMLSSASAASGTNLTAASKVILLDPVYGTYEFRKNTEWQAIGRAYRTGQTKQVSVVRFIIKDTVEEEIYNENVKQDEQFKQEMKQTLLTDENINLSKDEIEKIAAEADVKTKAKEEKVKNKKTLVKKITVKKVEPKVNEIDSSSDSESNDD
jgi:SNF2 family DNA or RNA helicase